MAVFKLCDDFLSKLLESNIMLDYGIFIPGDEERPLPVWDEDETTDASAEGDEEAQRQQAAKQAEALAALDAIDEIQDRFKELSGGGDTISADDAGKMARELGFAPDQADIKNLHSKLGGNVKYSDLKNFVAECNHVEDSSDYLLQFFRLYDPTNEGTLTKKQIKNLLQNFGEPLADKEVEALFSTMKISGDTVRYAELVEKLLGRP